jgi:hypothetical protein
VALFKVLSQHFPEETRENHEKPSQDSRYSGLNEFEIYRIRSGNANRSTGRFRTKDNEVIPRMLAETVTLLICAGFEYRTQHWLFTLILDKWLPNCNLN